VAEPDDQIGLPERTGTGVRPVLSARWARDAADAISHEATEGPRPRHIEALVLRTLVRRSSYDGEEYGARPPYWGSERSSEFRHRGNWFKRDTTTGRIMNGSPKQHKGVRNEK
jgi:hypothetical protein